MRCHRLALNILAALSLCLGASQARSETAAAAEPTGIAIEDFSYLDNSGEPTDQTAVHQKRLQTFMAALRKDVEAEGRYRLVQDNARIRILGGIQKMSTLVQWAKVTVIDLSTNRVLYEKLYTFRGDNDTAWEHAEAFVSREIRAVLAAPALIGLAVFEFELEDTTAAAQPTGIAAADAAHLAEVTNDVRKLLAQSGRYRIADLRDVTADAIKARNLRDCGGCDAAIALKLGAEQSLIGVVRRVSRTEYTVGFQVRDAKTGTVVSRGDSGLRMGADYAWSRGAVRLVRDRLLENPLPQ